MQTDMSGGASTPHSAVPASTGSSYQYRLDFQCKLELNGACMTPVACVTPVGTIRADVYRREVGSDRWVLYSTVCVTHEQAVAAGVTQPVVTPGMVQRAFERLSWPVSRVVVQPPGGTTLVNLATIFHTTNTRSSTRVVRLLGQRIEVRATPSRYVWHHGDGTVQETSSPGHSYPQAGHTDVTHTYPRKGRVVVRVDTVYVGQFRIGNGGWIDIPDPRTIVGPGKIGRAHV